MIPKTVLSVFSGLIVGAGLLASLCSAQSRVAARPLRLVPEPKEVQLHEGASFRVGSRTVILVDREHQSEDRIAAETLAEEIAAQAGLNLSIVGANQAPRREAKAIVLARLEDRGLREFLESKGIKIDDSIGDQGYVLYADKSHLIVAAHTGQGVFYGVQTLRQLLRPEDKSLVCPAVAIRDWPSMPWRGMQDDVSRGPIPTMEFMKKQIRILASYKINLFGLYMEHVFDFASQPLMAPKEAALTPEEIKTLVEYAKKFHVTVLPEQQAFGHLHHMLKYEIYSDVAERPHGHVLTPTKEQSYDIIKSFYAELVPLFPGPFLHIGADETSELGRGQTVDRVKEVGVGRVYLEHLQKVSGILEPYHKQLMFWGDIAVKYPQLLGILPKDVIAVPWEYDAKPSFDSIIKPYRDAQANIDNFKDAYDWTFYRNNDSSFRDALNSLDQAHEALAKLGIREDTDDLFWADPFTAEGAKLMQRLSPAARDIRLGAEHTLEALYRNRSKARVNSDTLGDMEVAAWRFDTLGMKIQFTEEINKFYWDAFQNQTDEDRVGGDLEEITAINARLEDMRDSTTRVREMYRKAWLQEDRPYWLDNVLVRYDNLAREFQAKIVAVRQARRQYYATKALAPPEELGFYLEP